MTEGDAMSEATREEAGRFVRRARRWLGGVLLLAVPGGGFFAVDAFVRHGVLVGGAVTGLVLLIVVVVFAADATVWLVELQRRR